MKIFKDHKWLLIAGMTLLVSCSDDDSNEIIPEEDYTSGEADFSNYVSLGNSLTAGYSDGALFVAGQLNSFPNLLAERFALVGGGEFTQPLMNDNLGGMLIGGQQFLENRLFFNGSGPARLPGQATTEVSNILQGPFNNMGVPGAKSFHLLAQGYGSLAALQQGQANPYFVRFASAPNASILGDALSQSPSFFSLWVGNNDVLGYAITGGSGVNQTGNFDPSTYNSNDITDPVVFQQVYNGILSALTGGGAKGVVVNIPYVTNIPYFTTVPYNPVPLDEQTAAAVNQGYANYNGGLAQVTALGAIDEEERAQRTVAFKAGQNPVVIVDEDLTDLTAFGLPSYRMATPEDLLILPGANFIGTTVDGNPQRINGVTVPLGDEWVLTEVEIAEIKAVTDQYNATISAAASQFGLALVDMKTIIDGINSGVAFDQFTLTGQLVFGGAFSLDGIHLTPRGNAFAANTIMQALQEKYGVKLPRYKAQDFGISYPASL